MARNVDNFVHFGGCIVVVVFFATKKNLSTRSGICQVQLAGQCEVCLGTSDASSAEGMGVALTICVLSLTGHFGGFPSGVSRCLCMFMLFRDRHGWTHSKQLCPSCPKQVTKC